MAEELPVILEAFAVHTNLTAAHLRGPEIVQPLLFLVQAFDGQGSLLLREDRREVELHLRRCQGLVCFFVQYSRAGVVIKLGKRCVGCCSAQP